MSSSLRFLLLNADYPEFVHWLYAHQAGLKQKPYAEEIKAGANTGKVLAISLSLMNALIEPDERHLLSFAKGYVTETALFYQKEQVDLNIKEGDRMLDIGSGAYAFPYVTYIVDVYEEETTHRREPLVRDDRPFELCNIEGLPHHDKEFDFIYF